MYQGSMASEKPTMSFVVNDELRERINNFGFNERIETKSEAIGRLLEDALKR
jgi:hypothetical protein